MPSVSIHTLGCKLNFAESGTIGVEFQSRNFDLVPFGSPSDVTVINTCTVTEEAERKCRQSIRRALRANPDTFVVVTGCYAQIRPDDIASISGVDAVLGTHEKLNLFDYVQSFSKQEKTQISVSCIDDIDAFGAAYSAGERTRAFLKVQDGCDYVCAFCTIPKARGKSRSATITDTVRQAESIGRDGFHEIVLSGVNIGLFGNDTGETLFDLLRQLDGVEPIERYRISSIEPNLLTNELIDFVASSKKFMPHFHMPLQSGDDEILGRMRRRYRTTRYRNRVDRIRDCIPNACIGADVIVGHPGETADHFERTRAFLAELPISYLHVFTYSERPETAAVNDVQTDEIFIVPKQERSRRNRVLRVLSERKRAGFYRQHIGSCRPVLWEKGDPEAGLSGFTDNYVRVEKEFDEQLIGQVEHVRLDELTGRGTVRVRDVQYVSLL